jgi:hypothetical protein
MQRELSALDAELARVAALNECAAAQRTALAQHALATRTAQLDALGEHARNALSTVLAAAADAAWTTHLLGESGAESLLVDLAVSCDSCITC